MPSWLEDAYRSMVVGDDHLIGPLYCDEENTLIELSVDRYARLCSERSRICGKGDHVWCDGTLGIRGYCLCACHPEHPLILILRAAEKRLGSAGLKEVAIPFTTIY